MIRKNALGLTSGNLRRGNLLKIPHEIFSRVASSFESVIRRTGDGHAESLARLPQDHHCRQQGTGHLGTSN